MDVIRKFSPVLFVFVLVVSLSEKVMAATNHLAYKYFSYSDNQQTNLWENLFLFTTDLSAESSLSLRYGLDAVSSASISALSGASSSGGSSGEDDGEEGSGGPTAKYRNSAGISYSNHYTDTLQGTTGLDFSIKDDFKSATLGQSINTPILGDYFTLGAGAYYTYSKIQPVVTTINSNLLAPPGDLQSRQLSYVFSLERILSTTSKIKFLLETFNVNGYLSTGYHFVSVTTGDAAPQHIENLPDKKVGTALTAIYSQGLSSTSAIHFRARAYTDTFGVKAYSGDAKYRTYLADATILELSYRYYLQTAARFFVTGFSSLPPTGYYTSQPALSSFTVNQLGVGIRQEMDFGILSGNLDGYFRNDGFSFFSFSAGIETDF